jgi:hypothetical protein
MKNDLVRQLNFDPITGDRSGVSEDRKKCKINNGFLQFSFASPKAAHRIFLLASLRFLTISAPMRNMQAA